MMFINDVSLGCLTCYINRNGTGTGGTADELEQKKCDFEHLVEAKLIFQHGETSKQIAIRVNPECQVTFYTYKIKLICHSAYMQ